MSWLKNISEHTVEKTKTQILLYFPKVVPHTRLLLQEMWQTHGGKRNGEQSKHNTALHKWHLRGRQCGRYAYHHIYNEVYKD
jgi:hypothetical protein